MKGKKFLAGILSAAMVLATMAVPAFADSDETPSEAFVRAFTNKASTITLTGDVTFDASDGYNPVRIFDFDCTIDLAGYKLTKGSAESIWISNNANVKFKNGTISMGNTADKTFLVKKGTLSFEKITGDASGIIHNRKDEMVFVDVQNNSGNATINFDKCNMDLTGIGNVVRCVYGNTATKKIVSVNDTTMKSKRAIWGGDTAMISGTSSIIGTSADVLSVTNVYATSGVTFGSYTSATPFVATVTTAATETTASVTTAYDSIDTAFSEAPAGSTITLYDDVAPTRFNNEVTNATTIDLNNHKLTINEGTTTHDIYWGQMTFKNGTIDVLETYASNAMFCAWDAEDTMVFDHVTINAHKLDKDADDISSSYVIQSVDGTITLKDSTINVQPTERKKLAAVIGVGVDVTLENTVINVENISGHAIITQGTHNGVVTLKGNTVINANKVGSVIFLNYYRTPTTLKVEDNAKIIGTDIVGDDEWNPNCDGIVMDGTGIKCEIANSDNLQTTVKAEAKIGNTYYSELDQALAAATAGDVITLLSDAVISNATTVEDKITKAKELNLNGKTLTMAVNGIHFGATDIVGGTDEDTRGKIIMTSAASGGQGVIYVCYGNGGTMNIKNVDIDATALTNGSVIEQQSFGGPNYVVLDNTKIDAQCAAEGLKNVIVTYNDKFEMNNSSEIKATNVGHAINTSNAEVVIDKSTVTATNCEDCIYSHGNENAAVTITGASKITASGSRGDATWNPTAADILLKGSTPYTKADTATVNATVYRPVTATSVADALTVKFVPTTNAREYDIVVVPTENTKTINRLTTADLTFALSGTAEGTSKQSYEIIPEGGVNVQKDGDVYHFNFDGVNEADKSGVEVTLGTVKFGGYGEFNFVLADSDNATARRIFTTTEGTNIVTECSGDKLTAGGNLSGVTIALPKATLTINIDFPNSITDNANAYQDMHVTIKGGDHDETINLGNGADERAMVNGVYPIIRELPLSSYNVTVYGAGYRTARYTVQLTEDKTLHFWNDAKVDGKKLAVEENVSEKVASTFLAGELVDDGEINLYDLNAVVSYFGKKAPNTTDAWDLACYDLDRNGIIDSRDVAFVLVSWGK